MKWVRFFCCIGIVAMLRPAQVSADEQQIFQVLIRTIRASDDPAVQVSLMKGMLSGLEGRRDVVPPESWGSLYEKLSRSDDARVRERAAALSQVFGDQAAVEKALNDVLDRSLPVDARRDALGRLLNQQNREASELLVQLMDEPGMTVDAIRGVAIVENKKASQLLLDRYSDFNSQQQRAVIETLASRKVYAELLLNALKSQRIERGAIPAQVARSLTDLLGEPFIDVFGEVREVAQDRTKVLAKYKALCNPDALATASAARGRAVYEKTCAACHMLYGAGGKVGPDLTGSNRANLDYILLNSVDPSYDVPDAYRTVSVLTVDGRSVNGVLAEEDARRIVLKTPEQPRVVIAKEDIEQRKISPKSMMPEGQLDQMTPEEVLDLIKYLRTTQQVEMDQ